MQRRLSVVFAAAGYVLPLLWLRLQYQQAPSQPGGCGLWVIFAYFWGAVLAILLSGTGTSLAVVAWRGLQKPRPWVRSVELAGIALPAAAGAGMICLILPLVGIPLCGALLLFQLWLARRPGEIEDRRA